MFSGAALGTGVLVKVCPVKSIVHSQNGTEAIRLCVHLDISVHSIIALHISMSDSLSILDTGYPFYIPGSSVDWSSIDARIY